MNGKKIVFNLSLFTGLVMRHWGCDVTDEFSSVSVYLFVYIASKWLMACIHIEFSGQVLSAVHCNVAVCYS